MKRSSNTRQRLVLNHTKKPSTPLKPQLQTLTGLKFSTVHSPLVIRDSNALKLPNSSNFGQDGEGTTLLRCRSISSVGRERVQSKPLPSLSKFYSSTQQNSLKNACPEMQIVALDFTNTLKKHGYFFQRTNQYCIPCQTITDLILDLGQKIREQLERSHIIQSIETLSSNADSEHHLSTKNSESFAIENQFGLTFVGRSKQLSFQGGVMNIQLGEEALSQLQCSEEADKLSLLHPQKQAFTYLCHKFQHLQNEITQRQAQIRQLSASFDALMVKKQEEEVSLKELEMHVRERQDLLAKVEQEVKGIDIFVHRQPNRILQQEAQGYKQREQELFDLAFLLEASSPQSINTYVQESILIPFESFKLTLRTFSSQQPNEEGCYTISKNSMESFQTSINAAYESTIAKLKSIIDNKASKIRDFVGIMRRLASYTIGKREYLTQINKKMASASMTAGQQLAAFKKAMPAQDKRLDELAELFDCMKNIYCEAEVFY